MSGAQTLDELYPGRWRSLLFPLNGKVPAERGVDWLARGLAMYEDGDTLAIGGPNSIGLGGSQNVGLVVPPGLMVLDADSHSASEWLAEWLAEGIEYPMQWTREGRCHFWVQLPDADLFEKQTSFRNSAGVKIDIRLGGKGYVVVAPSIHPDTNEPYAWAIYSQLPPDPDDVPLIDPARVKQILDAQAEYRATAPVVTESVVPAEPESFENTDLPVIATGDGRHAALIAFAAAMVRKHPAMDAPDLRTLLDGYIEKRVSQVPPITDRERDSYIQNGMRFKGRIEPKIDPVTGKLPNPWVRMSTVTEIPIDWIWKHYLAAGKTTMFEGDGGIGKSAIVADLAARITTGEPFPGETEKRKPRGVVIAQTEDDLGDTMKARLVAAGANDNLINTLRQEDYSSFEQTDILEACARDVDAALIVIDPAQEYLGGGVDAHRDNEVREALGATRALAGRLKCALVMIRHLNKSGGGGYAAHAGGGSVAFTNMARIQMLVTRNPDGGGWLSISKTNLAPQDLMDTSRCYSLENDGSGFGNRVAVHWGETIQQNANACLEISRMGAEKNNQNTQIGKCCSWLAAQLDGAPGPILRAVLNDEGQGQGFSDSCITRALKLMGATGRRRRFDGKWEWSLEPKTPLKLVPIP